MSTGAVRRPIDRAEATVESLQAELAASQRIIVQLQRELADTNRGVTALVTELDERLDALGGELANAHAELKITNTELLQLTLDLDGRVAQRTGELHRSNEDLRGQMIKRSRAELALRQLNAELDQRVRQRTAELEAANKELEAFAYSVSHDLRAPLRSIDGFSRIVLEASSDKLDGESRENLGRVRAAARRMGELIEDLLKLSRAGRVGMRCGPVDLSALARVVTATLQQGEPVRRVEVVVAPGLEAVGDRSLLWAVLENLLGNAWKFTGRQAEARIGFGMEVRGGERVYFVRDNGVGFNEDSADKLFSPFHRLHSQSDFSGNGIGLATVQRIVQRHGGRVWAESRVNEGATFYFTLGPDGPHLPAGRASTSPVQTASDSNPPPGGSASPASDGPAGFGVPDQSASHPPP